MGVGRKAAGVRAGVAAAWAAVACSATGAPAGADSAGADAKGDAAVAADGSAFADAAPFVPQGDAVTVTVANPGLLGCPPGRTALSFDRAARRLRLGWCGRSQEFDVARWRFGRVDQWRPDVNYAPTNLPDAAPDTLRWLDVQGVEWTGWQPGAPQRGQAEVAGFAATVQTGNAKEQGPPFVLRASVLASGDAAVELHLADPKLRADTAADKAAAPIVYLTLSADADPADGYHGLGEMFDTPQHRGKARVTQLEGNFNLDGSSNEAHVRVPLLSASRGWAWFVDDHRPATFDVAAADPARVTVTLADSGVRFFLLAASHPLDLTARYWRLTGAPALPARWAFGNLVWRNENKDQAEVLADAAELRKRKLPASGIWLDRPFDVAVNDFGFDPAKFPAPAEMIASLRAQGLRVGEWSTPYLDPGYAGKPKAKQFDLAKANQWFVEGDAMWSTVLKWGPPLDFTNPAVASFWQGEIGRAAKAGIEGWKLDYGEDIVQGLGPVRLAWRFADGSDERTMHRAYQLLYHAQYASQLPADFGAAGGGGWILSRTGAIGDQAHTSIIWPGDLCAGWVAHGECTAANECHAGGLPASVAAAISLPTAGYPLYGADTGGYRHGRAPKELYLRWLEHTALTGILQIGGSDEHLPWIAGPPGNKIAPGSPFDAETVAVSRRYWDLHLRLFPLFYSEMVRARALSGPGPIRPLGFAFPALARDPGLAAREADQWLVGDALLVAPVITAKAERPLWFPPGAWRPWAGGADVVAGAAGVTQMVAAPLDHLPLYQRVGAIVPMLRPGLDTLAPATAAGVSSFANDRGALWLQLAADPTSPAGEAVSRQWDGAEGRAAWSPGQLTLKWQAGAEFVGGAVWVVTGIAAVGAVAAGAGPLAKAAGPDAVATCAGCWWHDAQTATLTVRQVGGPVTVALP